MLAFDSNEWCMKDTVLSGGFEPRPLSHESSAVITRPVFFNLFMVEEPKMTKINFAEPKSPLKKLCGTPTFLKLQKVPNLN